MVSGAARADEYDIPNGTQPIFYCARPLTLPALTLSPRIDATVDKLSTTTASTIYKMDPRYLHLNLAASASFGIVDSVEVGAVALPLQALPTVAYGDPSVHGTFRFLKGGFELAAYINTTFITHTGVDPQLLLPVPSSSAGVVLQPGMLMRIHMGKKSKLDLGATLPIQLGSNVHNLGLNIPLEFAFNIFEYLYLGVTSGVGIVDVTKAKLTNYIPLGFIAGGTIPGGDKPVVDIGASFRWPQFVDPGSSGSKLDTSDFQVGLSVAAYIYFM
jgi:hypothetical protein